MEEGEVGAVGEAGAEDAIVDHREVERRREVDLLPPRRPGRRRRRGGGGGAEVALVEEGHLDLLAHGFGVGVGAVPPGRPVHFHSSSCRRLRRREKARSKS